MPDPSHEYWSSVAREKRFSHPIDVSLLARHVARDARILDLGCGYGRLTSALHSTS